MATKKRYWLVKSEPDVFSYADLVASKNSTTLWDGVRNYQARNTMRDDMKVGDLVLYYHSNTKPPGVVGVAEVVREGYPDPTQFDPNDSHFDPKAKVEDPTWIVVDVRAKAELPEYVPLDALKANAKLAEMAVIQRGQRLSVQPVSAAHFREVLRMGGLKAADLG
ncbi:EVE domain protein [Planctomycetes bacterium Poly30]|uniref:EVE domain protein n=1 Tax=Saltatorellus ferox TaxID=2528018 RepID=A0A518EUE0_9BACT|nr:EVE domain protein [Planctomycetes bacterium Poly30]